MTSGRSRRGKRRKPDIRRRGRAWGLSLLYAVEFVKDVMILYQRFPSLVETDEEDGAVAFARELAQGVRQRQEELDTRIQASSPRWRVQRMALIDRNILRLASYELFHVPDVPPRVVINEAVELAKRFGAEQTRNFVNGILQQICVDNGIDLER